MRPLSAALLLAAALPAWSQGAFDPKKDFEQKFRAQNEKAAREHVTLGKFCAGKKLHAAALLEYRRALKLDANCTDAKRGLSWKFEGGAWVPDPSAVVKSANEGKPEAVEKALDEYDQKRRTAAAKSAKEYSELAAWAAKKSLKEEAKAAWRMAWFYDSSSEEARAGSGWVRTNGYWVSPADADARQAEAKRIAGAGAGERVAERSEVESRTGWSLAKRTSEHFRFEGMYSDAEMATLVRTAEATRLAFIEAFELPADALKEPILGVFLKTKEDHVAFLEKYAELRGRELDEHRNFAGWAKYSPDTFEVREGGHGWALMPDWTVHQVAEFLFAAQYGIQNCPAWLREGIAYWFTYRMTSSALTNCVSFDSAATGGEDWEEILEWKRLTKERLREGKSPPMREVLEGRLNSLDGPKGVKGWSLVDWMLAARRTEFLSFLGMLGGGTAPDVAIREAFGVRNDDELEAQWAEFVLENY